MTFDEDTIRFPMAYDITLSTFDKYIATIDDYGMAQLFRLIS